MADSLHRASDSGTVSVGQDARSGRRWWDIGDAADETPDGRRQEYTVPVVGPNPVQQVIGPVPVGSNVYTTTVGIAG